MLVRPVSAADLAAIQSIYAHHVLHGTASFEETPPTVQEMRGRYEDVVSRGLPYLAAEESGEVIGYGYCALYRTRTAYRYTLEDSVYVREGKHRKGVGRAILTALIERSEELGYRQLIAIIGDRGQVASIGLHASLGFLRAGMLRSVGFKFGRWIDTVVMQRPLGRGDGIRP